MAEELFRVEYDSDGMPKRMHIGKYGIKLDQEDAQRIFDEYFDMRDTVDIMRDENAKLKNQNKWLRKAYTALRETREQEFAKSCEAATNSMGQIGTLRDKNAELRELVKDMWQTISKDDGCGWDMDENCCTSDECTVSCKYWYRMKELGIEVDV